jgi:hypothetical protein
LVGLQLLSLGLNPSLDPFPNTAIGAFDAEIFEPLNFSFNPRIFFRGQHSLTRLGSVRYQTFLFKVISIAHPACGLNARVAYQEWRPPAMAPNFRDREWYSIAEKVSKEMDSAKLTILVAQLCRAMDEREKPPCITAIKLQLPVNLASFRSCW